MSDQVNSHEVFSLSPTERKRRQDMAGAIQTLNDVICELKLRMESGEPNLRARQLISQSQHALQTMRQFAGLQNSGSQSPR